MNRIKSVQHFSSLCHQMNKDSNATEDVSIELMDPKSSIKTAKYTLFIVDRRSKSSNKFAGFIVPLGRFFLFLFLHSSSTESFRNVLFPVCYRQGNRLVVQLERGQERAGRQCQIPTSDRRSPGSRSPVSQSRIHPERIGLCRFKSPTQRLASKHAGLNSYKQI